jgi:hypothetical protein
LKLHTISFARHSMQTVITDTQVKLESRLT